MNEVQTLLMHYGLCAAKLAVLRSGASIEDIEDAYMAIDAIEMAVPRAAPDIDANASTNGT
jgi:hypothetical protein